MDWVVETILPKEVRKLAQKIDEKDSALALLNDDLNESQRNVAILEQNNVELQHLNEILQRRAVPYLNDSDKDNGMTVIHKNDDDEFHYYGICGQHIYRKNRKRDKLVSYPHGGVVLDVETPNAIVHYNWLKEIGCIIPDPERPRHFRLGRNMTHQQLLQLQNA